ncbi:hypothetical protein ACCT04_14670 [Rhizobium ruizarguesonis]
MDNNEYLRQVRAAGRIYGGKLADKLAFQVSRACATKVIVTATLAAARAAAATAVAARSTAPFIETDAAAAWRDAALAVIFERIDPASNLALYGTGTYPTHRREEAPAAADFDVSVA